jgi:nitrile hydratase accessory protein
MNQSDDRLPHPHLTEVRVDQGNPVFSEPWEAQAFALAVQLSKAGNFSWKEWADALSVQLKSALDSGQPDDGSHYYHHWLAALERLVTARGLASADELAARKRAWTHAYRNTPHGQPVELERRLNEAVTTHAAAANATFTTSSDH